VFACAYIGARFAYVVFKAAKVPQNLLTEMDFFQGGLSGLGAIWGACCGFLLGSVVHQQNPYALLDEIAIMILPSGVFCLVARWLLDAALYRNFPADMVAYLP
jgi:prolipoprotein diacylglyceryltransferase